MTAYTASVSYKAQLDSLYWITEIVVMISFGLVLVFGPVLYRLEMVMFENTLVDKNAELTSAHSRIRELAIRDELTGVYNRRYLMEVLAQQKAMADRREYKFALCYVDLDFLKRVNDRFGHSTGDYVLRDFSEIAQSVLRELDCVSRIGGEEFVLVLAGTSQNDAKSAANRIGEKLSKLLVSSNEPNYRISASMGITEFRKNEDIEETMDRAAKALYEAKRTGRNKVVIAGLDH